MRSLSLALMVFVSAMHAPSAFCADKVQAPPGDILRPQSQGLLNGGKASPGVYRLQTDARGRIGNCYSTDPARGKIPEEGQKVAMRCSDNVLWQGLGWLDSMFGFQYDPQQFPREEITGTRWTNGWTTICVGEACADVLEDMRRAGERGAQQSWPVEILINYQDIREHTADACSELTKIPDENARSRVANTTSLSPLEERLVAAKTLMPVSNAFHQALGTVTSIWGSIAYAANKGFEVEFTYADGGKETFFMVINADSTGVVPAEQPIKAGSHKPGDGKSKCPRGE